MTGIDTTNSLILLNFFHMKKPNLLSACFAAACIFLLATQPGSAYAQATLSPEKLAAFKKELITEIDKEKVFSQQMVDMIFSFGELGFQETETSRYLTDILKKNGFTIESGISGIPTAWMARWGSGKPVIAIGSDID